MKRTTRRKTQDPRPATGNPKPKTGNRTPATGNRPPATGNRTPLAEGVIPLNGHGHRNWASLTDDEIIEYAKNYVMKNGIRSKYRLQKEDMGLYIILRKRKLQDKIGLKNRRRDWVSMTDEEFTGYVKRFMEKNGIMRRIDLARADSSIYQTLQKRGLLDSIGIEKCHVSWYLLSDEALVHNADSFLKENGIKRRSALQKKCPALYKNLRVRKLLDQVGFGIKEVKRKRPKETRQKKKSGRWAQISDAGLVEYAKRFCKDKGIRHITGLVRSEIGLYRALKRRNLLDLVGFEERRRNWASMTDKELIDFTRRLFKEKGITLKITLQRKYSGLYKALHSRELLDKIGFKGKRRSWKKMSDEILVEYAKRFISENGITSRKGLDDEDSGLSAALRKRKLMDYIGLPKEKKMPPIRRAKNIALRRDAIRKRFETKKRTDWLSMGEGELIEAAIKVVEGNGVLNRRGLIKANQRLYYALKKRNLLDGINLKKKTEKKDWTNFSDEELVEHANGFVKKRKIKNSVGLKKQESGLYHTLARRKLLGTVYFEKRRKRRNWAAFTDEELVEYSKRFVKENGIHKRNGLIKDDEGLYQVLVSRNLLDLILPKPPKSIKWSSMADEEIVAYAQRYVDENNIKMRIGLGKALPGLCNNLRKRGLLDEIRFEITIRKRRNWASMSNKEILEYAMDFMHEKRITQRKELKKADSGLYDNLGRRKLITQVFSDIEQSKDAVLRKQLLAGLSQAADAMEAFGEQR